MIGTRCEIDGLFVSILAKEYQNLRKLDQEMKDYTTRIKALVSGSQHMRRVMEIPGFGAIAASSFVTALGDNQAFKCGRVVSPWLGLMPRQHSTGGKQILLGISKRGNRYLSTMLVNGTRAVTRTAEAKDKKILSAVGRWKLRIAAVAIRRSSRLPTRWRRTAGWYWLNSYRASFRRHVALSFSIG